MHMAIRFGISVMGSLLLGTGLMAEKSQKSGDIELVTTDFGHNPSHVIIHTTKPITAGMFFAKGARPIEVAVTNHGSKLVTLTNKSVQIKVADIVDLSREFHIENQYTPSLLLDAFCLAVLANGIWMHFTGPLGLLTFLSIGFFPGGLLAYLYWNKKTDQNKQMTTDFIRDLLELRQKPMVIQPGQTVRRFLVLDNTSRIDAFTFTVYDGTAQSSVARFSVYI